MTSLLSIDDMRHESTFAYDREIEFNRWHMSHHIFVAQVSSPPPPLHTTSDALSIYFQMDGTK